jgi:ankyrin repeat protein
MNNEIKYAGFFVSIFIVLLLSMTLLTSAETMHKENARTYQLLDVEGQYIVFYLHELEGYDIASITIDDVKNIQADDIEKDLKDELTREIAKTEKDEEKISDLLSRIDTTKWLYGVTYNKKKKIAISQEENSQIMYTLFDETRKKDRNKTKIIELLEQVVDIDMPFSNRSNSTLLYDAVQKEDAWMSQKLLEYGARMGKNNSLGENPSSKAISHHVDKKILKIFFDYGLDPNRYITQDQTILSRALWNNKYEKIKLIVDRGADVNLYKDEFYRPIKFAIKGCKSIKIIKLLIDRGANTDGMLELIEKRSYRCKGKESVKELLN